MTQESAEIATARQALLYAALMKNAGDEAGLGQLVAAVDELPSALRPDGSVAANLDARRAAVCRRLTGMIDERWAPALVRRLERIMVGQAASDGPDAVRTAEALVILTRTAGPRGEGREATRRALSDASRHIRMGAESIYRTMTKALESPDAPDLGALSLEMLRLEALRLVSDALDDRKASEEFAYISRRIARIALTRGAATIDAFLAERDLLRLFDNAAVVGRVDDMLTLALRVLDGKLMGEEEATPFVEPADQTALHGFIAVLSRLADALLTLAGRAAAGEKAGDVFFAALLQQIACIFAFCRRLRHAERPQALDRLAEDMTRRLGDLTNRVLQSAEKGDRALRRAEELAGALTAMNLPELAAPLLDLPPPEYI